MATTKDLIRAGLLLAGEELIWVRKSLKETHVATVSDDGAITTADGKSHKTPSGAARHLNGNKPVDGWLAWKVKKTNISLTSLREKLI